MHRTDNTTLRTDRLWNPQFTLLIVINVITNIGFGMLLTSISLYVVDMGASLAIAGSMASVFSLVAMFMRPLGGRLFDCFNKRNSFILSTLAYGAISVLYSFTTNVPMLFVLRIIHGVAFSLSGVTNMALVSLFISKKRMNEGLGYYNAGMLIGQAVAPTIAQYYHRHGRVLLALHRRGSVHHDSAAFLPDDENAASRDSHASRSRTEKQEALLHRQLRGSPSHSLRDRGRRVLVLQRNCQLVHAFDGRSPPYRKHQPVFHGQLGRAAGRCGSSSAG